MKRYFTFFLCAQSWKPAVVILPPLLNNIQAVFSIGNNLQFSTSKLDHSTLNSESKTWTGDILEGELLQSSPQVVFIQKMARKSGIFDFFFRAAFYAISFHLVLLNVVHALLKMISFTINFYFYFTSPFVVVKRGLSGDCRLESSD